MKKILLLTLLLSFVKTTTAQLIATVKSALPPLELKEDVELVGEVLWNIDQWPNSQFFIEFFGRKIHFQKVHVHKDNLGYTYLSAHTKDNTVAIELSIHKSKLKYGILEHGLDNYILIAREGSYFLCKKKADATPDFKECGMADEPATEKKITRQVPPDQDKLHNVLPDDNCNVRLLILYSDNVANAYTDPELAIQAAVARMNVAFNNSNIGHNVEIALIEKVPLADFAEFDGNGNAYAHGTVFNQLESSTDGVLDYLHDLRDLYDADMVQMIMTQVTGSTGSSWAGYASAILAGYSDAFALTRFTFLDNTYDHTMAHEFGHLYGCRHDTSADSSNNPFPYGHGHVNLSEGWRTVMATKTACSSVSCSRITHYSNPAVNYNGVPTGIVGTSDNQSVIDTDYSIMVNFQNTPIDKTVWASDSVEDGDIANIRGESTLTTSVAEPYNVYPGGVATFVAPDSIILTPGFRARPGSSFRAFLGNCTTVE